MLPLNLMDEQLLLFVSTRSLKRRHPNPGFIQTEITLGLRSFECESEGAPEQFSYKLSEIDAFFRNKVKGQFSSVPARRERRGHTPPMGGVPLIFCIYDFHR